MRITSLIKLYPLFLVISILPTCIFTDKYLLVELEQVDDQEPGNIKPITSQVDEESHPPPPEEEYEEGKNILEIVCFSRSTNCINIGTLFITTMYVYATLFV